MSRQQDVIVEDVNNNSNHYQPDNPRDNDRVQQEPEDVDENIKRKKKPYLALTISFLPSK